MTEKNHDGTFYAVPYERLVYLGHMDKRGNNVRGLHSQNLQDYDEFKACLTRQIPVGALITTKESLIKCINRHIDNEETAESIWEEMCGQEPEESPVKRVLISQEELEEILRVHAGIDYETFPDTLEPIMTAIFGEKEEEDNEP